MILLTFSCNKRRLNWFIKFIIHSMANSMWKLISKSFYDFGSIKKWFIFHMDYIVDRKIFFTFSCFFFVTFVISLNVSTCSFFTYSHDSDNKPMLKCFNTNVLILTKIGSVFSWLYTLKHPWNLLYNVIVLFLYSFTNHKTSCFSWFSSSIKFW
jgi:hypothetical protein